MQGVHRERYSDAEEIVVCSSVKKQKQLKAALKKAGKHHFKVRVVEFWDELLKMKRGDLKVGVFDSLNEIDIDNFGKKRIEQTSLNNGFLVGSWRESVIPNSLLPMWKKIRGTPQKKISTSSAH